MPFSEMHFRTRLNRLAFLLLIFLAIAVCWQGTALAQCPMCKRALSESPESQRLAEGFNQGILFLLAAPVLIAGTVGLLIYRTAPRRD